MKTEDVPQERSRTYGGMRKLLYAVDERGEYRGVNSVGWEVETYATVSAVDELNRLRDEAFTRAQAGTVSTLEYHMYRARMDPPQLASATGIWRWRVKRHLRPSVFRRLSERTLQRYANALGLSVDELLTLPDSRSG